MEQTEVTKRSMPWWGTLGWVLCGVMTLGLVLGGLASDGDPTGNPLIGIGLWVVGFALGLVGLIVRGR